MSRLKTMRKTMAAISTAMITVTIIIITVIKTDLDQIVHLDCRRAKHALKLVEVFFEVLPGLVSADHRMT